MMDTLQCCVEAGDGVSTKTGICGAAGNKNKNTGLTSGFITSPNYPQRYSADTNCQCVLNASNDQSQGRTEILFQVRRSLRQYRVHCIGYVLSDCAARSLSL